MTISNSTPNTPTKICNKCGAEYPATEQYFHKKKHGKYGVTAICRDCQHKRSALYEERYRETRIAHYYENRDQMLAKAKTYQETHKEQIRLQKAKHQAEHPEVRRNYQIRNAEKLRAKAREYAALHREEKRLYLKSPKARAQKKLYKQSPAGKASMSAYNHRRRLQRQKSGKSFTPMELQAVIAAHTDRNSVLRCALCGKPIKGKYHIDHWIPLCQGGTNDAGNLRIMHPKCNLKKQAKLPHELGKLI